MGCWISNHSLLGCLLHCMLALAFDARGRGKVKISEWQAFRMTSGWSDKHSEWQVFCQTSVRNDKDFVMQTFYKKFFASITFQVLLKRLLGHEESIGILWDKIRPWEGSEKSKQTDIRTSSNYYIDER